ncbi:MAG: thiol-disulfide isomerase/thioredoxin [Bacteroidia bacterium]|jgi:thiol-disulfide isomerase/thioredoxin
MRNLILMMLMTLGGSAVADISTLKGTISGEADETGLFIIDRFNYGVSDTFKIDPKAGSFEIEVDLMYGTTGTIHYKDKTAFVRCFPGKVTNVEFEGDFLESTLTFNGEMGGVNSFFASLNDDEKSKVQLSWLSGQAGGATNVDGLEMSLFKERSTFVKKMKSMELDEFSQTFIKRHFGYYYYLGLLNYSSIKSEKNGIPKATEIPTVSLESLTDEIMNRESSLSSNYFRELIMEYVRYMTLREFDMMKFGDEKSAIIARSNFAREHLKGKCLQYYLAQAMRFNSDKIQPSELKSTLSNLTKEQPSVDLLKQISSTLEERLSAKDSEVEIVQETRGRKYDLELTGLDGKSFGLDDLKGKVVYVDIWASWCGPCRQMFPYAKKMHEDLSKSERKKIEFLYISIDNTETKWKEALEKFDLQGKQGFSPGGWGSDVTRVFKISSIPRYLIFNKKGELVDHNAPRPANPETIKLLRSLL